MISEEIQCLVELEKSIDELSWKYREEVRFNFLVESELQCWLFGKLRLNRQLELSTSEGVFDLVRSEFPAYGASWKARHDIVVWRPIPDLMSSVANNIQRRAWKWPNELQESLNLFAIEIECLSGMPWDIRNRDMNLEGSTQVVLAKMRSHPDIRKLVDGNCEIGFYLFFWDDDPDRAPHLRTFFDAACEAANILVSEQPKLRIHIIPRRGELFKATIKPSMRN